MQTTKLLLANHHHVLRAGLRAIIATDRHIEIVAEAADSLTALHEARRLMPDVALIETDLPFIGGFELTRQITLTVRFTRVILMASSCRGDSVQRAILTGAFGYLSHHSAEADLLNAIREVDAGNAFFSQGAIKGVFARFREALEPTLHQRHAMPRHIRHIRHLPKTALETVQLTVP